MLQFNGDTPFDLVVSNLTPRYIKLREIYPRERGVGEEKYKSILLTMGMDIICKELYSILGKDAIHDASPEIRFGKVRPHLPNGLYYYYHNSWAYVSADAIYEFLNECFMELHYGEMIPKRSSIKYFRYILNRYRIQLSMANNINHQ